MNSEREWLQTCLYGQHDIWADWVRFGERVADSHEAAGWGTPHALRLLNEQNARWLEATRLWVQEWERLVSAGPDFDYGARQALVRNRIFQTWLDTVSGFDWDQWHLSMRQAFLLLQQAFQAAQALPPAPAETTAATGTDAPADTPAAAMDTPAAAGPQARVA